MAATTMKSLTGTLTVNSFNLDEAFVYKECSKFFMEVSKRGYKNVIIDIRNNPGGNPGISALFVLISGSKRFQKRVQLQNSAYRDQLS